MSKASIAVLRAILLSAIAFVVIQTRTEVTAHAESECVVQDCHLWYGDPCTECPQGGQTWCSYFCWSCVNGSYGCSP